jgi:hypothetical protein
MNPTASANVTATTSSLRHGWVSGPDGRGTLDILWTCLVTLCLGSWSILFLNIPAESSGRTGFFKTKGRWMVMVLLFPEMITALAAEQWRSARQSVEDFRKLETKWEDMVKYGSPSITEEEAERIQTNLGRVKASPWSMRHAFFADMGGITLKCPDFSHFPVTAYQLNDLIAKRHILYPGISQREIWDKNKADGFARLLTIVQIVWFSVQCIGRAAQHLAVTTLELSTLAFIFCAINTLYFWTHKPLDVAKPISLECKTALSEILKEAGKNLDDGYAVSPLEFMNPPISRTSLVAPFWVGFDVTLGKNMESGDAKIERLSNTRTIPPRGLIKRDIFYGFFFVVAYFGIHLVAWRFAFPTRVEQILWRVAVFMLLSLSAFYFTTVLACNLFAKHVVKWILPTTEFSNPIEIAYQLPRWAAVLIHVPFFLVYVIARIYIIVEGFYNLRALSNSSYLTIKWENFLPHIA